jgi:hypothetical protein
MQSNRRPNDNDEFANRPARQPDYASENKALVRLARAQTGPETNLWQEIAEASSIAKTFGYCQTLLCLPARR